jgi:hypothetical protein
MLSTTAQPTCATKHATEFDRVELLDPAAAPLGLLGLALVLGIGIHIGWRFARADQHANDAADPAITADD